MTPAARISPIAFPPAFSCKIVGSDGDIIKLWTCKRFQRLEHFPVVGTRTITICNRDSGTIHQIDCESQTYFTVTISPERLATISSGIESDFEWEPIGVEFVDGHLFDKYQSWRMSSESEYPDSFIYIDSKTNMRRRIITINKMGDQVLTIDYNDIIIGELPKKIYQLPDGLRKVSR